MEREEETGWSKSSVTFSYLLAMIFSSISSYTLLQYQATLYEATLYEANVDYELQHITMFFQRFVKANIYHY